MKVAWLYSLLLLAVLHATAARADEPGQPPTQGDINAVRRRVEQARRALDKPDKRFDEAKRRSLLVQLDAVENSLVRYEKLHNRGSRQQAMTAPLYVAGAVLIADDATIGGVADDILLPFIGLGILGIWLTAHPPTAPAELERAWTEIIVALEAVGQTAVTIGVEVGATTSNVPDRGMCRQHLVNCLGTSLGRPGSGRSRGHSSCVDCVEVCRGEGTWPDRGRDGKDCRWWQLP